MGELDLHFSWKEVVWDAKPGHTQAVAPLAATPMPCNPLTQRVADGQAPNAGCYLTDPRAVRPGRSLSDPSNDEISQSCQEPCYALTWGVSRLL